ncbi:MAG: tRNA (adenosine(37)-N6)-threonylcarbamoyltransferase complex dimerization subunit type 1 TsaB [Planctomycetales bacterium]|nr:tRNA (adenosine(37)-N6)-threonylcarbamoyltransferase complex dimerization subunit type 1 TsaB [Planctomycetales bacterium]
MPADAKTLALETSTRRSGLALLVGTRTLAAHTLSADADSARLLMPLLAELLDRVGWRPGDLELIGVSVGPGSFTGLRIGITTAKTLAYATGAQVVAVDTLRAIAAQSPPEHDAVRVASDAGRGEAYTATFHRQADGLLKRVDEPTIINRESWLGTLDRSVAQTGSALARWLREIQDDVVLAEATLTDEGCWTPTAETVGRLAIARHAIGETDDLWELAPRYIRRSAAEDVWEAKHGGKS